MTERLYYDDPSSREFDATILRVEPRGTHHSVWLDRSSFYPTSGGQPFDTGTLGDGAVIDVHDEDGDVIHVVQGGTLRAGAIVHGAIDWNRRFDHMQQHTGQHVLSAAFVRSTGVQTVSFHLGAQVSTIDLARDVRPDELEQAEDEANRVVWQNREVSIRYADAAGAADLGLRKASARTGRLRLIDIADFDLSACGGSHVDRTGGIGVIAISGWERFKGGLRVEFVCGGRALRRHRVLRQVAAETSRLLSVHAAELPAAIERLQSEFRTQKRALTEAVQQLGFYKAQSLAGSALPVGQHKLVIEAIDADAQALKSIASAIVAEPGFAVVLVSASAPSAVVATRSSDVSVPCDAIVKGLCAKFGGRGGGKPDLAQGGGLSGDPMAFVAEARALAEGAAS